MVQAFWGDFGKNFGKLDRRGIRALEEVVVIGQFKHLLVGDFSQFLAAIADIDAPQTGHTIKIAFAVRVLDKHAFGTGDHPGATVIQIRCIGERMNMVCLVDVLPIGGFVEIIHNVS